MKVLLARGSRPRHCGIEAATIAYFLSFVSKNYGFSYADDLVNQGLEINLKSNVNPESTLIEILADDLVLLEDLPMNHSQFNQVKKGSQEIITAAVDAGKPKSLAFLISWGFYSTDVSNVNEDIKSAIIDPWFYFISKWDGSNIFQLRNFINMKCDKILTSMQKK